MNSKLFRVRTFPVEGSLKCACIIAGYRGKTTSYRKVIKILNERGFSVIAYEHTPRVLTSGDPRLLLDLVNQICDDFSQKSSDFKEVICVGASIGAGLCLAVQRKFPKVKCGIYAGAGVSPPENIFEAPLFYFVRQKFSKQGFSEKELKKVWSEIDILPSKPLAQTPIIMVLGKKDRIVKYDKALTTLKAWQDKGKSVQVITKANLGHFGVIRWHKSHFEELLAEAKKLS